jgi:hypothetical protein
MDDANFNAFEFVGPAPFFAFVPDHTDPEIETNVGLRMSIVRWNPSHELDELFGRFATSTVAGANTWRRDWSPEWTSVRTTPSPDRSGTAGSPSDDVSHGEGWRARGYG